MAEKFPVESSLTEFSNLRLQIGRSIEDLSVDLGFSVRTLYRWEKGEHKPREAVLKVLKSMAGRKPLNQESSSFTFIDLFAGIGGLRRGFEPLGGKCIFTSEWNKYAKQTYLANFVCDHEIAGDITKVHLENIPGHDLLLAGFPCQPFSIAGVSKKNALNKPHGFRCEAQGTLFFDVARIIEHHKPKAFVLENVKNLVNHDKGNTFRVIHKTLTEELGYHVQYRIIDAKSWVPQHRERIFIAGFREKNGFDFESMILPDPFTGPKLGGILHSEDNTESVKQNHRFIDLKTGKVLGRYTLTDKLWNYLQRYAEKHRKKGNGFGFGLVGPKDITRTLSARYYKDGSEILVKQSGKNPRRLTPRECSRLMGFDTLQGNDFVIPVSDTQAYKQFGNAVVVPVVKAVAEHVAPWVISSSGSIQKKHDRELIAVG